MFFQDNALIQVIEPIPFKFNSFSFFSLCIRKLFFRFVIFDESVMFISSKFKCIELNIIHEEPNYRAYQESSQHQTF